jgi:DNA-binding MarR family transcriptional regulator
MTVNFESDNLVLRLWFMIHRTHGMLKMCEDRVFSEHKLTTERYVVLVTIKYLDGPVRTTDVARWLGRSPNSISMMVDRMVKAGLLRRVRDRNDRREVRLVITSKGETALEPATLAGWEFIKEILSKVSSDDGHTLMRLLDRLQYEAAIYLNPGADITEIRRKEAKRRDNLMKRLVHSTSLSTPGAKRRGSEKRKTIG